MSKTNPRSVDHSKMKDNLFADFKITPGRVLDTVTDRSRCSRCHKSRKYYCYNCLIPMEEIKDIIPFVKLPLKIEIIKHARELDSKSTAPHAVILAPEDVALRMHHNLPDYNPLEDVLIFPCKDSVTLDELQHMNGSDGPIRALSCIKRAIFVDCTWFQTGSIVTDPQLQGLKRIELKQYETKFWRPNGKKPSTYLATVEAIYYFIREYHELTECSPYDGQYDNLLFFFKYMYAKIKDAHGTRIAPDGTTPLEKKESC